MAPRSPTTSDLGAIDADVSAMPVGENSRGGCCVGSRGNERGLAAALGFNSVPGMLSQMIESPRNSSGGAKSVPGKLDAPFANPVFLSNTPRFLQRQRSRAACALVSEHVASITCSCLKCAEAATVRAEYATARKRVQPPEVRRRRGSSWTPGGAASDLVTSISNGSAKSSTAKAHVASVHEQAEVVNSVSAAPFRKSSIMRSNSQTRSYSRVINSADGVSGTVLEHASSLEETKDLAWLLKNIAAGLGSEMSRASGEEGGISLQRGDDCFFGNMASSLLARSMQFQVGFKIPDTVILEKGKPTKRYKVDSLGQLQVARPKTSADLLRVLREFVKKASRPRPEWRGQRTPKVSLAGAGATAAAAMRRPNSEGALRTAGHYSRAGSPVSGGSPVAQAKRSSRSASKPRNVNNRGTSSDSRSTVVRPELSEAAVLYYNDQHRTVGLMTIKEAERQMQGAGKLPRDFWQHIHILQAPVQSALAGGTARYITYSFDVRTSQTSPQAPLPSAAQRRAMSASRIEHSTCDDAAKVGGVPAKINDLLKSRNCEHNVELVSGQLEFVYDEADGALWLVSASRLRCHRSERRTETGSVTSTPEEVRYFREEEFMQTLNACEEDFADFRRRSAYRELKIPDTLAKYNEAESWMLNYFNEEVKNSGMDLQEKDGLSGNSTHAVGLGVWFRRWAKLTAAGLHARSTINKSRRLICDRRRSPQLKSPQQSASPVRSPARRLQTPPQSTLAASCARPVTR
eukprot:TRINITY_DN67593_c0_g1_i1.p1 TRINITY_DN67593_c0_g1~~TRINITY_DN67593_c0_g1_i1.p1  ORF type:complete len:746 (+),score=93.48 TRINITY_DN67593_c0_g1_i1:57-2294(+)